MRVCSAQFSFSRKPKKRVKPYDIPSVFAWSKAKAQRPMKRWREDQQNTKEYSDSVRPN